MADDAVRTAIDRGERRRNGIPEPIDPITYSELVERYLAQYDARSKRWFMDMLKPSLTRFGSTPLRSLRPDEIAIWLAGLPHAASTNEKRLDTMRQVLKMGVEWGYLIRNPARPEAVKGPTAVPTDVRPFASWDEVFSVANLLGPHRPAAIFAASTGTRSEEWIALEPADVSKGARTCLIEKTFTKGTLTRLAKNEHSRRTILLPSLAVTAVEEAQWHSPGRLLFPAAMGGYLNLGNWRKRIWYPALDKAGLERRPPYQLRHTFATLSLAAGASIEWISRYMGHSDIRTTLRYYARFLPETDTRNLDLLDAFAAQCTASRVTNVSSEPDTSTV
jgi:integrase